MSRFIHNDTEPIVKIQSFESAEANHSESRKKDDNHHYDYNNIRIGKINNTDFTQLDKNENDSRSYKDSKMVAQPSQTKSIDEGKQILMLKSGRVVTYKPLNVKKAKKC